MGIAEIKAAAGYQKSSERDRCGNCKHREQRHADRAVTCKLNDFITLAGAICNAYAADKAATPPPL